MLEHLTLHEVIDYVMRWVFCWNLLYIASPPREWFNSPKYDLFLKIVAYYGGMNVRQVSMKLYGVVQQAQPPVDPPKEDK